MNPVRVSLAHMDRAIEPIRQLDPRGYTKVCGSSVLSN
jgi:hypothetical protein